MTAGSSIALVVAAALVGCSSTPPTPDAGMPDASATGVDAAIPFPAPPVLTPCPPGWRTVTDTDGVTTCDPWPGTGYDTHCAFDEAMFAGTPGCARIGTACAADGWPSDLPAGRRIVYVDDDAPPGGDGASRATAFATISGATSVAPPNAVIAIATAHYDERVSVGRGVTLWGACVGGTRLTASASTDAAAVIDLLAQDASARNLAVDSAPGVGVWVDGPGRVDDVVISAAGFAGIFAGADVVVDHVAIRDTVAFHGGPGDGIYVDTGAMLTLTNAVVEGNLYDGIVTAGGQIDASDVAVRSTRPDPDNGQLGQGLTVLEGGSASLTRVVLEANHARGLWVDGARSGVAAHDLVVRDTVPTGPDDGGNGVVVSAGATFTAARLLVERNEHAGVWATDDPSHLDLSDFVIRDTAQLPMTGTGGYGIELGTRATCTAIRGALARNTLATLFATEAAAFDGTDLAVRSTIEERDGPLGMGVLAQGAGTRAALASSRVEGSTFLAIGAFNGALVVLDGVTAEGAAASTCGTTTCAPFTGGFALIASYGGTLSASGFAVSDADLCGVVVGANDPTWGATAVDLSHGSVDHAPVGACLQVDGYDATRLAADVQYRDVGVPLQATTYALPTALAGP